MADTRCKGCGAPLGAKQATLTGGLCPACARLQHPDLSGPHDKPAAPEHRDAPQRPPRQGIPNTGGRYTSEPLADPVPRQAKSRPRQGIPKPHARYTEAPSEKHTTTVPCKVSPEMFGQIQALAASMDTSVSALVRQAIADYLNAHTPHS